MHQDRCIRVQGLEVFQATVLELFVHDAGPVPQQNVCACGFLDIATQVLVRRPQDFFAFGVQMLNNGLGTTGGNNPISPGLYRGRGIGINHDGAIRVLITELRELVCRATNIERAGRLQGWHQNLFLRIQNLCRLSHETNAGNDHGGGRVLVAEARHFQGIRHTTTGLFCQPLDVRVGVIMRNQNGILLLQSHLDPGL